MRVSCSLAAPPPEGFNPCGRPRNRTIDGRIAPGLSWAVDVVDESVADLCGGRRCPAHQAHPTGPAGANTTNISRRGLRGTLDLGHEPLRLFREEVTGGCAA
jgi:hypothetical protein